MLDGKTTARFEIVSGNKGNVYRFYCGLSNSIVCEIGPLKNDSPEKELMLAWEEGRKFFNQCHKCGKWIIGAMYNPDVLNCVSCSPIQNIPNFCPKCGVKVNKNAIFCHICGEKLMYGG